MEILVIITFVVLFTGLAIVVNDSIKHGKLKS